jgi:hypothetical protein
VRIKSAQRLTAHLQNLGFSTHLRDSGFVLHLDSQMRGTLGVMPLTVYHLQRIDNLTILAQ